MSEDLLGISEFESEFKTVEAESSFFDYPVGSYQARVGKLVPKYKDANKKKCEKGDPGAIMDYAMQELFIISAPYSGGDKGEIISEAFELNENFPTAAFKMQNYVSFKPDFQFPSINFYSDFTIEGSPGYNVVTEKDGKKSVNYPNINAYIGIGITFDMVPGKKKPESKYPNNVKLVNHVVTKEILDKGKLIEEKFTRIYDEKIAKEQAERKAKSPDATPAVEAPSENNVANIIDGLTT